MDEMLQSVKVLEVASSAFDMHGGKRLSFLGQSLGQYNASQTFPLSP